MSENTVADIEEERKNTEEQREEELADAQEAEEKIEEDLSAELEALKDKYKRLSADFENYRKRSAREKQETLDFGNAHKLKELLFVVDNIERAIEHSEESHGEKTDFIAFLDGIKLVHAQFLSSLESFGVTAIDSGEGTSFNPSYHEAIYKEHSEIHESGVIISEAQRGYLLNGRLLRPSMVSVSQGAEKPSEEDSEGED